jgi:transcriptional regulator with XRE-family HTH domain
MIDFNYYGKWLLRLRVEGKGDPITQEAAAAKCGMTRAAWCNIETGKKMPRYSTIKKIAEVFGEVQMLTLEHSAAGGSTEVGRVILVDGSASIFDKDGNLIIGGGEMIFQFPPDVQRQMEDAQQPGVAIFRGSGVLYNAMQR